MSKSLAIHKLISSAFLSLLLSLIVGASIAAADEETPTTFDNIPMHNVYPNDFQFGIGIPIKGVLNLVSVGEDAYKWRFKSIAVYGPGWSYGGKFLNYVKTGCKKFVNAGFKLNDPVYGSYSLAMMKTPLLVARHTKDKRYKFSGTGIGLPKHLQIGDELSNRLLELLSTDLQATPLPDMTKIYFVAESGDTKLYYISVKSADFKDGTPGGGGWLIKMTGENMEVFRSDRAPFGVMLQSWADIDGDKLPDIFLFEALGAKKSDLAALIYLPDKKQWKKLAGLVPCQ